MADIADLIKRDPDRHALAASLAIQSLRRQIAALQSVIRDWDDRFETTERLILNRKRPSKDALEKADG